MDNIFDIEPAPTFWAPVVIPVAGGESVTVKMQFVHLDRDQYQDFWKEHDGKIDRDVLPLVVTGWEGFRDDFSALALERLLTKRPRAGRAIIDAWRDELFGAQEKN